MLRQKKILKEEAPKSRTASSSGVSDLKQLRKLLLGEEHQSLLELQREFSDHSHVSEKISQVISEAISIRARRDDSIPRALIPSVEDAIRASVKRDPKRLSNALFPVMGPAIRESLTETVSALMQQVNQLLENSFSARSIKWRFNAFRSKRSFAEVMLLETMIYQVEQVFLIHRESRLLINHLTSANVIVKDPDMVSGMLTVVTDFIKDSFVVDWQQNVKSIKFGRLDLLFEAGPHAIIVVAVRGLAPSDLQITVREQLEALHRLHGRALEHYDGNAEQFPNTDQQLNNCLLSKKKDGASKHGDGRRVPWKAITVLSILPLFFAGWWLKNVIGQNEWDGMVMRLQEEPGIVVLSHGEHDGKYSVSGLLDPLAKDPKEVISGATGFDGPVRFDMESYFSNEPVIVNKRLLKVLQAPATVTTTYIKGHLSIEGEAQEEWIASLPSRLPYFWGISSVDTSELLPVEGARSVIHQLVNSIERTVIEFAPGSARLTADDMLLLSELSRQLKFLQVRANKAEQTFRVGILGLADSSRSASGNNTLSEQRARSVHDVLVSHGVNGNNLLAKGLGTFDHHTDVYGFSKCASQRCVSFEIYFN